MDCPKCQNLMNDISEPEFSALRCGGCNGIWFKDGSHEIARKLAEIPSLDSGNTNAASAYNEHRDIDCPECSKKMTPMTDRVQLHIQYEACTYCDGVFFDAGEFSDLTEFTLTQRVKQAVETLKLNLGLIAK
ncbi:hypothetical protein EOPP23_07915 [Endozoicomonas sp. OPT23]|uniref:zf-TFIIB domain-containing protein n=1 Tax=Endozoicomonas sp. OPT23 TaxID=2072845 RepID=UPI00129A2BA0|nr:zf-TFIIB domain-containing protein [Endozoicomonas sp. OPT23]MRI32909.1 hypothetical protein [Endozoicomonas sp. OPT23]